MVSDCMRLWSASCGRTPHDCVANFILPRCTQKSHDMCAAKATVPSSGASAAMCRSIGPACKKVLRLWRTRPGSTPTCSRQSAPLPSIPLPRSMAERICSFRVAMRRWVRTPIMSKSRNQHRDRTNGFREQARPIWARIRPESTEFGQRLTNIGRNSAYMWPKATAIGGHVVDVCLKIPQVSTKCGRGWPRSCSTWTV